MYVHLLTWQAQFREETGKNCRWAEKNIVHNSRGREAGVALEIPAGFRRRLG